MALHDHARRDEIRAALSDPRRLCETLGLADGAKGQAGGVLIRCPSHSERNPSCSVTAGPEGGIRVKCHACGFSGDAFTLVAKVNGLELPRDFAKVLDLAGDCAGIGAPVRPLQSLPPAVDVGAAWAALPPLDVECWEYLRGRGLEDAAPLCRSVPAVGAPANLTGMRIAAAMRDAGNRIVAIQARNLGDGKEHDFRVLGSSKAGVFGDPRRLLDPAVKYVIGVEGLTDYLAASIAIGIDNPKAVVFGVAGVENGAAFKALPFESRRVVIASDADDKGDAFAAECIADLGKRKVGAVRARPVGAKDICAMREAGGDVKAWLVEIAKEDGFRNFGQRAKGGRARRLAMAPRLIKLGQTFVDDFIGGLRPNDKLLIGAKQGAGKTEIASIFAMQAAAKREGKDGPAAKRVHFFALEADEGEIEDRIKWRLLSAMAWDAVPEYQRGRLTFTNWGNGLIDDLTAPWEEECDALLAERFETLHTYYRKGGFSREDMARIASGLKGETDLIILDHLHFIDIPDANENRGMRLLLQAIDDAATTAGASLVLLAHLRKLERKGAPLVPMLDDFRGSSDIGGIVTRAITIARAADQTAKDPWLLPTYFRIAKNRPDGSRCQFVALVNFDIRSNSYSKTYKIGRLVKGDTEFEPLPPRQIPAWAIEHADLSPMPSAKRSGRQGSEDDA